MKIASSIVAALAAAVLVAGCGSHHAQAVTPHMKAISSSKTEREWLQGLSLNVSSPAATTPAAARKVEAIQGVAREPGVEIVRLNVYRSPALTTSLVLAVSRPAYFLLHQLKPILPKLNENGNNIAYYVRIVDGHGKNVLEWSGRPARNSAGRAGFRGTLYVRPGLELCSPILAVGFSNRLPPCPSK